MNENSGIFDALKDVQQSLGSQESMINSIQATGKPLEPDHLVRAQPLPWIQATIRNNEVPNDDLVITPLIRSSKTYFCSDCIHREDDLKLQTVLRRKFRYGLIDLRPEVDAELVIFCLNCNRVLNNKAFLKTRFPDDLEGLSKLTHNEDQYNDFFNRRHGHDLRKHGFSAYRFTKELLGEKEHEELALGCKGLNLMIPYSTHDREFCYNPSNGLNSYKDEMASCDLASCNPMRKLHYWTNAIAGYPQFRALRSKILTGVSDLFDDPMEKALGERVAGRGNVLGSSVPGQQSSSVAELPHKVYFLGMHPTAWSVHQAPSFTVELVQHSESGHVFGRAKLPNISYMIAKQSVNEPGPHVCRLTLPARNGICGDIYVACAITDCDEAVTDLVEELAPQNFADFRSKLVSARNLRFTFIKVDFSEGAVLEQTAGWKARLYMCPDPLKQPDAEFFCYETGILPTGAVVSNTKIPVGRGTAGLGNSAGGGDLAANAIYNRVLSATDMINPGVKRFPVTVDVIIPRMSYSIKKINDEQLDLMKLTRVRHRMFLASSEGDITNKSSGHSVDSVALPTLIEWREDCRFDLIREGKWIPKLLPIHLATYLVGASESSNFTANVSLQPSGWDYAVDARILAELRLDPRYMQGYLLCVDLLLESWGYDLTNNRTGWKNSAAMNDGTQIDDVDVSQLIDGDEDFVDKITVKHPASLDKALLHKQAWHLDGDNSFWRANQSKADNLNLRRRYFCKTANATNESDVSQGCITKSSSNKSKFSNSNNSTGGRIVSSSLTNAFSRDGWKLRHLLMSLKLFNLHSLYDLVVEITEDILSRGACLNLADAGWEEALANSNFNLGTATSWYRCNLANCGEWNPSLRELVYYNDPKGLGEDASSRLLREDAFMVVNQKRGG